MTRPSSPSSGDSPPSTSTGGAGGAAASAGAGGTETSGAGGTPAPAAGGVPGSGGSLAGSAGLGGAVDAGAAGASNGGNTNVGGAPNGGDPKFLIFLLLGQSNMEGQPQPEPQDLEENPRVQVLGYDDCPTLPRSYGEWDTASPPMHSCGGGVGPGDYFARALLETLPDDYTIGLVPCAVNGAPIDLFRKNVPRTGYYLPPDDHWETGYEWIVSRAQTAQRSGVIRGILFHQGESNNGQADWVEKVSELVTDLRTDLSLGNAPFLAGELYYDGNGGGHNPLIRELTEQLADAHLVSAEGLTGYDIWHFDLTSQRELGRRYGEKMIEVLEP